MRVQDKFTKHGELKACFNPDKWKQYRLTAKAKRYGLQPAQWLDQLLLQQNKCSLCKNEFKNPKDIHTDHNHADGVVRGFLCMTCNLGLGYFKDSAVLLRKAIEYLQCS